MSDNLLTDWRDRANTFEQALKNAVVGQDRAIHLITLAVFAGFSVTFLGEAIRWNFVAAGLCLVAAVIFIFLPTA